MLCATDRLLQTELPPAKYHAGLFSQIHTLAAVALKQLHADVPASTDKWTINGYLPNICSGRYNCLFERRSSIAPPMWGCGARETLFGYMKYVAHPNEWFESLIREHAKRLALPIAPRERPRAVSVHVRRGDKTSEGIRIYPNAELVDTVRTALDAHGLDLVYAMTEDQAAYHALRTQLAGRARVVSLQTDIHEAFGKGDARLTRQQQNTATINASSTQDCANPRHRSADVCLQVPIDTMLLARSAAHLIGSASSNLFRFAVELSANATFHDMDGLIAHGDAASLHGGWLFPDHCTERHSQDARRWTNLPCLYCRQRHRPCDKYVFNTSACQMDNPRPSPRRCSAHLHG